MQQPKRQIHMPVQAQQLVHRYRRIRFVRNGEKKLAAVTPRKRWSQAASSSRSSALASMAITWLAPHAPPPLSSFCTTRPPICTSLCFHTCINQTDPQRPKRRAQLVNPNESRVANLGGRERPRDGGAGRRGGR